MSFLSYDALVRTVNRLHGAFPSLQIRVIGRSLCGRGLFAFCLGACAGGALVVAGLRGSDRTSGAAALAWAETVCRCIQTSTPLCGVDLARVFSKSGITVLPCLNPDGMEIGIRGAKGAGALRSFLAPLLAEDMPWEANAAGVRLDRQFPCGFDRLLEQQTVFGSNRPAADGFCGQAPLSEPEARALTAFCREQQFSRVLVLETGEPALSVFPAQAERQTRETVLTTKMLASCAGVPFLLPTAQEGCGTFPAWFAETMRQNAFTLSLDSDGDTFYRRIEEALVLFAVI